MKIIAIDGNYAGGDGRLLPCLIADSAILQGGNPFFIPDFADDFRLFPSLAVKVCKLGKRVVPRFAERYWSEMAICMNIRAVDLLKKVRRNGEPWTPAVSFDGSAVFGKYRSMAAPQPFTLQKNGEDAFRWDPSLLAKPVEEVISFVSRHNTLKTGDVIIFGIPCQGVPIALNDTITASYDNESPVGNVKFNIK